jgi:hypothetical protein
MLQVGQTVECHYYVGNSGFLHVKRVIVLRLGKRVTIEVPLVKRWHPQDQRQVGKSSSGESLTPGADAGLLIELVFV